MRKILMLYPFYWPLYKAGGPVQSLYNLAGTFKGEVDFYLLSLDRDIDGERPHQSITLNTWTKGPQGENIFFVSRFSWPLIFKLIGQIKPDVLFINGIFNLQTTLPGLLKGRMSGIKIIISPRGMLQSWALKRNARVKAVFLFFLKWMLKRAEEWHATDHQEKEDIWKLFGRRQYISVASNIPRGPGELRKIEFPGRNGEIKLVFLSLINPNKNLHSIIEEVIRFNGAFTLDIYGPVIDTEYWRSCERIFATSAFVKYKGPVLPWDVPSVIVNYHFFVLPTQGENFGHAIFDALASGVPVIISRKTPWNEIDSKGAGVYIDIDKPDSLRQVLEAVAKMVGPQYDHYRMKSLAYAQDYWNQRDYRSDYSFLIDDHSEPSRE